MIFKSHAKAVYSKGLAATLLSSTAFLPTIGYAQDTQQAEQRGQNRTAASSEADSNVIIVTAQRKSQDIQDVGIAISAYGGEALQQQGITVSSDVASLTPGVTLSGTYGGQSVQFSIRGVTQSDFNDAIEAPVAVYIDDIYIASQQGQSMALFDIERVEALKGPQGTLFGRNATGGLVNFVIEKPKLEEWSGYIDATYGRFQKTALEGALNIPLGENVAIRASAIWDRNDSMWNNVYNGGSAVNGQNPAAIESFLPRDFNVGENLGDKDTLSGRIQLYAELNEDWNVRLSASGTRQRFSESPWASSVAAPVVDANGVVVDTVRIDANDTRSVIGPNGNNYFDPSIFAFQAFQQGPGPIFAPTGASMTRFAGQTWFGYYPVDIGNRQLSKDYALRDLNTFDAYNFTGHVNGRLGDIDLTWVTGMNNYKKEFLLDADASPGNIFLFGNKADIDSVSTELRFSQDNDGFNWQAGLYYLHVDAFNAQGILGPNGSYFALVFDLPPAAGGFGIPGALANGVDPLAVFRLKTDSYSVFGQFDWEFAPDWTVVMGGRVIKEDQNYDYGTEIFLSDNAYSVDLKDSSQSLGSIYPDFVDSRKNTYWAGKLQLEYRPNSDLLLYAGVNRGVKGGSYNGQYFEASPSLNPNDIPYNEEVLLSYEAGFKLSGYGFRLNGTVFHYDYSDYQSYLFQGLRGQVSNLDADSIGVELDGSITIVDGLQLSGQIAYIDANVRDFPNTPTTTVDLRPTYTPEWSGNTSLSYTTDLGDGTLYLAGSMSFQSSFFHNAQNFSADKLKGWELFNLNASYKTNNGLSVGGYIKNLFDKRYASVGLDLSGACGCNLEGYGEPMTWGLKIGYEF
tara:strand:- start:64516 stop:67068 length:2553 start_codon:yes stop_codon:yes gene_type:complete